MTTTHPARRLALLIPLAILVAACGPATASPSVEPSTATTSAPSATPAPSPAVATPIPSEDLEATYDAIESQVAQIRGLTPTDVARETIDAATLKEMNATSFDKDNPADYVAGSDRLLKALGLLSEEQSLRQLYLDLIDSQVAGFYRPDAKTFYVVSRSGVVNGADKITFAHEYDHALQDANFPGTFDEQTDLLDESDQALARAAVYEGDATLLMTQWALPNLTPAELQDVVAAGVDPASTEVLARTPQVLVDGLLFPYNTGVAFLTPIQTNGGWAGVDAIYADLPVSTEQVLHPEKYEAGEAPVDVVISDDELSGLGDGWSTQLQDTYGEFQIGSWLRGAGVPARTAAAAAAGWGGDRLAVLDGPGDSWAVVMRTTWDTVPDADAFTDAANSAISGLPHSARIVAPGSKDVTVLLASDDDVLLALDKVFGSTGV